MKTKWLFEEFVESKSNILNLSTFNFVRILSNNKIINPDLMKIILKVTLSDIRWLYGRLLKESLVFLPKNFHQFMGREREL